MPKSREFVVNSRGKPVRVILDIAEYNQLLEAMEELEAIRAYDTTKASPDEAIPFDQAIEEIERSRG
jgi:PHD/YefM family antitoxin component YafN of YafNO toxin-antitoxin module